MLLLIPICCLSANAPSDGIAAAEWVALDSGRCLVSRPQRGAIDGRFPAVVCLHGTDTDAEDMMTFWRSLAASLPFVIVAPQGTTNGWGRDDVALLDEVGTELLRALPIDRSRVLLAGHSAGGAMAMHLLYTRGFPCTAVAVTANYVPSNMTDQQIKARAHVPVLYAVGLDDPNRRLMLDGLARLRANGAFVTVRRPPIGHVLDRSVGQDALLWFEARCRAIVETTLATARTAQPASASIGERIAAIEAIVQNVDAHFDDQVSAARSLLGELVAPGRRRLTEAKASIGAGQPLSAYDLLVAIEVEFRPSSLCDEARGLRIGLESEERVATALAARRTAEHGRLADEMWRTVVLALAAGDGDKARRGCTRLAARFPETRRAAQARKVLAEMEKVRLKEKAIDH